MKIQPISLILVVHQEADIIESVIADFYEKITSKIPGSEFIICEDGSTDGTKEILKNIKDRYNLTLDIYEGKRGYAGAMRDGFALAKNPVIFFSDSDGQHDPNDFYKLTELLDTYDIVIGWKKIRQDALYRLGLTFVFNHLINLYFGVKFHDIDCGFKVLKKPAVDFLLTQEWRLKHCIHAEIVVKALAAGYRAGETPISHYARKFGASRGLPLKKLPKIIFSILQTMPKIKQDVKEIRTQRRDTV